MTKDAFDKAMAARADFFNSLATSTNSVPELLLKVSVYGGKWTKLDWLLFFAYVQSMRGWPRDPGLKDWPPDNIMESMFDMVGKDKSVDAIVTNSDMMRLLVGFALRMRDTRLGKLFGERGYAVATSLVLLARAFAAYPELWKMNYMWTRRRGKERSHKLWPFLGERLKRGAEYRRGDAARQDFVSMFWSPRLAESFVSAHA